MRVNVLILYMGNTARWYACAKKTIVITHMVVTIQIKVPYIKFLMFDFLHMSHFSFSSFIESKLNSTDILLICYRCNFFSERNGLYTVDILRKTILGNNDKRTKMKTHVTQSISEAIDIGNFRDII